jgi:hypothetical protein
MRRLNDPESPVWGSWLRLTNCTEAVYLWKYFIDQEGDTVNTTLVDQYLLNGLQEYLKTSHLAQPNMTEIAEWRERPDVEYRARFVAEDNCPSEICPLLGCEGNSDVAGLGVSFSYWLYMVRY